MGLHVRIYVLLLLSICMYVYMQCTCALFETYLHFSVNIVAFWWFWQKFAMQTASKITLKLTEFITNFLWLLLRALVCLVNFVCVKFPQCIVRTFMKPFSADIGCDNIYISIFFLRFFYRFFHFIYISCLLFSLVSQMSHYQRYHSFWVWKNKNERTNWRDNIISYNSESHNFLCFDISFLFISCFLPINFLFFFSEQNPHNNLLCPTWSIVILRAPNVQRFLFASKFSVVTNYRYLIFWHFPNGNH